MKIQDKKMNPYMIIKDSHSYDVVKETGRVDTRTGNPIYDTFGHFSSVASALSKIIKLKVESNKTFTIREYIDELKKITIDLTQ